MTSPNVIFTCEYLLALKNKSNNHYGVKYEKDRNNDINNMFDYFSNPKKSVVTLFDYYQGHTRGEDYNLVLKNGVRAKDEDVLKRKEDYKEYIKNSNLWKGIISFNNDYVDNNITFDKLEERLSKEVFPQFLKYCGFKDMNKMDFVFSIHTNTNHYHVHFAFIEKKANYQYDNGKIGYRKLGMLSLEERNYLKRLVQLSIERDKFYTPLLKRTNHDIDELKKYFNKDDKNCVLQNINELEIEEKILKLGSLISEYRGQKDIKTKKVNFNSIRNNKLGKEIKKLTKDIKRYIFYDESSDLYNQKKAVDEDIECLNNYFGELNNKCNINEMITKNSITDSKLKYIDNYIYNSIINQALNEYENNSKITIEDLIIGINVSSNYKYISDNDRKKLILHNYFTGSDIINKFPNKYRVEKSLKNIKYELEQASQEFSKLFNYSEKKL